MTDRSQRSQLRELSAKWCKQAMQHEHMAKVAAKEHFEERGITEKQLLHLESARVYLACALDLSKIEGNTL